MAKTPGRARSCLMQLLALVVIALGYTGVRYLIDRTSYDRAHQAYLTGDCETAVPVYNQITSAIRFGDLGGYAALAMDEKIACTPFLEARALVTAGDLPGALIAFANIAETQAGEPLARASGRGIGALLIQNPPAELVSTAVCSQPEKLLGFAGLAPTDGVLAGLYDACGALFSSYGAVESAYVAYYALLSGFANHPLAQNAYAALGDNLYACQIAGELSADPIFRDRPGFLHDLYLRCGENYAASEHFMDAMRVYQLFLDAYPNDPQADEARAALARALIANARLSGAGEIALPEKVTGSGGDTTKITIQNDSPEKVRLVFTGPVTRIEELAPCPDCTKYFNSGPEYCPEKGPVGTYELPSGRYDVLVESVSDEGVIPFTGNWQMEGGEYYSCFFVVEHP